eukprot:SAG11_NODE_40980_length_199_cov_16.270000_1_plen_45_part_10
MPDDVIAFYYGAQARLVLRAWRREHSLDLGGIYVVIIWKVLAAPE